DADRPLADRVGLHLALFKPERDFPRNREEFDRESRQRLERLAKLDRAPRDNVMSHDVEDTVRADRVERGARAPDREGLALAEREEARRVIDVGISEQDRGDRRTAPLALRLDRRRRENLLAQVD